MNAFGRASAAILVLCGSVHAQPVEFGGWLVEVIGGPMSPGNPTVTVRVSAHYPPVFYAVAGGRFDLVGADPSGMWTNIELPPPLGPWSRFGCAAWLAGTPIEGSVFDAGFLQIAVVGCMPHRASPLPIWEAQWTTSDFTPRTVVLSTENTPWFSVYIDSNANAIDLVTRNQFRHGSAVIEVVAGECYADCDTSTGVGVLDVFDFLCFSNRFAAGIAYACDCDTTTGPGSCDIFDFLCFQNAYAAGCP